ncbi:hypothetical protein Cfor_10582 [Coptotermes formosanus]|uniref:Uncharacterized protein n=1 Tax=Coptotermes formosanus TaxID=36987 RepID=A0A6L2QCN7_COPFO|nr:hypothetical protein Cfor_10582 [Coptotermes formosanus]
MGFCQIVLVLLTLLGATPPLTSHGLGYNVEKFDRFPGVYFEQLGETSLSNTEWKFVVYIPLAQLIDKITATDQYVFYINQLRSKIDIRNWTTCSHFDDLISSRLGQVCHCIRRRRSSSPCFGTMRNPQSELPALMSPSGPGQIVNINISASNESLTLSPENNMQRNQPSPLTDTRRRTSALEFLKCIFEN